jgi:hypothetical protein
MSELFVSINMEKMDTIVRWLNGLVGLSLGNGKIVKILEWQVVPTGRPYEYSAFARVEVQHEGRGKAS